MLDDLTAAEELLRGGVDPAGTDARGTTPLYAASVQGSAPIVRALLAAGAPPDAASGRGDEGTPLCAAACWGHTDVVHALLTAGADPNLREDEGHGRSPWEWAMTGPYPETLRVLRDAGAKGGGDVPAPPDEVRRDVPEEDIAHR